MEKAKLKELILKGIRSGAIKFIADPTADQGTVAKIGDYWFYFGGAKAAEESPEEYIKKVSAEDIAEDLADVFTELDETLPDEVAASISVLEKSAEEDDEYKRYLVFIKSEYVRDTQAYLGGDLSDEDELYDEEHEGWRDAGGSVLIMDLTERNINIVRNRIQYMYPDTSSDVFRILEVKGTVTEYKKEDKA